MDTKVLFEQALQRATACMKYVSEDQMGNATPCSEWSLRDLLNHLVYEVSWVPDLLAGKTVKEVGSKYDGDLLGNDFKKAWSKARDGALKAAAVVRSDSIVHLSYGDVSADHYLGEMAGDVIIHTWDMAQSIRCSLFIDTALVETVYHNTLPRIDEFTASGLFGKPIHVAQDATIQTKLLALLGRKEQRV